MWGGRKRLAIDNKTRSLLHYRRCAEGGEMNDTAKLLRSHSESVGGWPIMEKAADELDALTQRIAELERENKELHAGDNLKAIVNEDTQAMFENCVGLSDEISNLRQRLSQAEANLIAFREAAVRIADDNAIYAGSHTANAIRNLPLPPAAEKLRAVVEATRKYVAEFERNHKRELHNDRHGIVEAVRQLEKEGG
jgi:hypothetical protein